MEDDKVVEKSAVKWANFYALRKIEIAQKDTAELFSKYNVSDEDIGRLSACMQVMATKEIVKRRGGRF